MKIKLKNIIQKTLKVSTDAHRIPIEVRKGASRIICKERLDFVQKYGGQENIEMFYICQIDDTKYKITTPADIETFSREFGIILSLEQSSKKLVQDCKQPEPTDEELFRFLENLSNRCQAIIDNNTENGILETARAYEKANRLIRKAAQWQFPQRSFREKHFKNPNLISYIPVGYLRYFAKIKNDYGRLILHQLMLAYFADTWLN